jgi:hypothetical protein
MRKVILFFISLQLFTGNLFSQNLANVGNNSPFTSKVTDCKGTRDGSEDESLLYYDLGGHLFAGQYPINNPFTTGDTGIIYLYRVNNNTIIPTDTTQFADLGYYIFSHVLEGKYILKARLTKNSTHYNDYFPTYFSSNLRWNSSNFLDLTDKSNFEANIYLQPTIDSLAGPASIKGYVVQASGEQGLKVMSNTEVILFNDKMDPLNFCISNNAGIFFFPDLPYGTYNLMAESTGKFASLLKITLDQNHTDFDSVLLEALSHNPATVEEHRNPSGTEISPAFPNPAKDEISLVIRTTEPENLNLAIFSLNGQKLISGDYMVTGIRSLSLSIGSLANGIYFLMVHTREGQWKEVQKFVKL